MILKGRHNSTMNMIYTMSRYHLFQLFFNSSNLADFISPIQTKPDTPSLAYKSIFITTE